MFIVTAEGKLELDDVEADYYMSGSDPEKFKYLLREDGR